MDGLARGAIISGGWLHGQASPVMQAGLGSGACAVPYAAPVVVMGSSDVLTLARGRAGASPEQPVCMSDCSANKGCI